MLEKGYLILKCFKTIRKLATEDVLIKTPSNDERMNNFPLIFSKVRIPISNLLFNSIIVILPIAAGEKRK